jgi:hypothetical protein
MRKILSAALLFACFQSFAQPTSEQKKVLFTKIDSLVSNYIRFSTFQTPGQSTVTPGALNRFGQLFTPDAKIPDEMSPGFFYGDKEQPEKIMTTTLPEYLSKMQASYPEGLSIKLLNANVSYKNLDQGMVKVALVKRTEGFHSSGLNFQNNDTIVLNLKISDDFSRVQISGIDMIGYSLSFLNDKDRDFVMDSKDKCPSRPGIGEVNGCPLSGAPDASLAKHFWITGYGQFGSYSSTVNEVAGQSAGAVMPNGSTSGGGIQFEYLFGPKANFGIGAGIAFSGMKGKISKSAYSSQFDVKASNNIFYRQIITAQGAFEEDYSVSTVSVPVVLILKGDFSSKLGFRIEGGINYNLSAKGTMNSTSGVFDYEAIYRYNAQGQTVPVTSSDPQYDWMITRTQAAKYGDVAAYFNSVKGRYPVGLGMSTANGDDNLRLKPNGSSTFKGSIGLIIRPSISYKINPDFAISLGIFYSKMDLTGENNTGFKLLDENRNYNSMLGGISKMSVSSTGAIISITHSLF